MQTAAPNLIDLSRESKNTLEDYGVNRSGQEGVFSRNLVLARKMVERGVRFVSVFQRTWDHHEGIAAGLPKQCREVDQPIAALLRDLKQRGMLDSTLIVWGTEFGRTAITQGDWKKAGRDHHPHAFSVWLAGGGVRGVRGEQLIGKPTSWDGGWLKILYTLTIFTLRYYICLASITGDWRFVIRVSTFGLRTLADTLSTNSFFSSINHEKKQSPRIHSAGRWHDTRRFTGKRPRRSRTKNAA